MNIWRGNKAKVFIILVLATVAIISILGIHIEPSVKSPKDAVTVGRVSTDGKWVITLGTEVFDFVIGHENSVPLLKH